MARPRKPNHLHLVQGTNRPGRHAPNAEPRATQAIDVPEPPHNLPDEAAACWRRLAGLLTGMGVLTDTDLFALERLCMCWQELQDATTRLDMLGAAVYETTSAKSGFMRRPHPEVSQRADADRRFMTYLGQFGLTPSARAKLALPGGNGKADKLNKYFQ